MSSRDDFANLTYRWLQNDDLTKPERDFVVEYLLRYLKGKPVDNYSLPDIIDWNFTGNNIIFNQNELQLPVSQQFVGYYVDLEAGTGNIFDFAWDSTGYILYVVGDFTTIGGVSTVNIVQLDITTGTITALSGITDSGGSYIGGVDVDSSGNVYVAGNIVISGTSYPLAVWDGSSWTGLGSGGGGYAVKVDGSDNVYLGGGFTNFGGDANADFIVRYNGSTFDTLGTGSGSGYGVYSIDIDSFGNLYMGGDFTQLGGVTALNVIKFDGSTFSAMSDGLGDSSTQWIEGMFVSSSDVVYALGSFVDLGYIAKWTGSAWIKFGTGVSDDAYKMVQDSNGNFYVCGDFIHAGGRIVNRLTRWNGTSFQKMGAGFPLTLRAIAIDSNDNLYVGGLGT